jgi:hypothetical protein
MVPSWRRWLAISALVAGLFTMALLAPAFVAYRDAFPADAEKRTALAACAREQPHFNRWSAAERGACYLKSPDGSPNVKRRRALQIASSDQPHRPRPDQMW